MHREIQMISFLQRCFYKIIICHENAACKKMWILSELFNSWDAWTNKSFQNKKDENLYTHMKIEMWTEYFWKVCENDL